MMRKVMTKLYIRLPIDKLEFQEKFGKLPEDVYPKQLKKLEKEGLIEIDEKEIKLTKLGDLWKANIAWEFTEKK
jgi:coproporphyrinogen III oxidase-like Fe-S oxidoreductase